MNYKFDRFGRFNGAVAGAPARSTPIAPSFEAGKTAYWSGTSWINVAIDEPTPAVVAPTDSITMRQFRLALIDAGIDTPLKALVNGLPPAKRSRAQVEFEYSKDLDRGSAFVNLLRNELNWTKKQMDDLFIAAAKL